MTRRERPGRANGIRTAAGLAAAVLLPALAALAASRLLPQQAAVIAGLAVCAAWFLASWVLGMRVEVQRLAGRDTQTGLPNEHLLEERFRLYERLAERDRAHIGILVVRLNTRRQGGIRLVRQAAVRLRGCVRRSDTVARAGHENYVVLLYGISGPEELDRIQRKIAEAFMQPFELPGAVESCHPDLGGAVYPDEGTELQTLVRNAEIRMQRADAGGNHPG